jgi:hypothetical protein
MQNIRPPQRAKLVAEGSIKKPEVSVLLLGNWSNDDTGAAANAIKSKTHDQVTLVKNEN